MAQANLPISFWGDARLTAAYIFKCLPSQIPLPSYELWKGESSFWSICPHRAQEIMFTIPCISARNNAEKLESASLQGILIVQKAMLRIVNTWV